jgi:hypothetical protein
MRISLYKVLFFTFIAFPALALDYHPEVPVNKYYYQCTSRMGPTKKDDDSGFKNDLGYIGLFQFGVVSAYEAGLCNKPVPAMRTEQLWNLCDFQGPIAKKYNLQNEYDFRFDGKATAAQFEMMHNLTTEYDDYIYQRKYDLLFGKLVNGVTVTPDILRGLLHAKGRAAVDDFLHGHGLHDNKNQSLYKLGTCLDQCMSTKATTWLCD